MLRLKTKIWFEKDGKLVFGEGRLQLLREIEKTKSISQAASNLNMSYRRAWSYLHSTEKNLGVMLVDKVRGGKGGGGSKITAQAKQLMDKFEQLSKAVKTYADREFQGLF